MTTPNKPTATWTRGLRHTLSGAAWMSVSFYVAMDFRGHTARTIAFGFLAIMSFVELIGWPLFLWDNRRSRQPPS